MSVLRFRFSRRKLAQFRLPRPGSAQRLFEWWRAYWASDLDLVQTIEFEEGSGRGTDMVRPAKETPTINHILILKRRGS